jgi:hypothetical protein
LSRDGRAHEIWYQFQGKAGVKLIGSTPLPILGLDILNLAAAYKEAGLAFIADLYSNPILFQLAHDRAQHFFGVGDGRTSRYNEVDQ